MRATTDWLSRREFLGTLVAAAAAPAGRADTSGWLETGSFAWIASPPRIAPQPGREDPCHAIKDPSVVFFANRWHLFCTIRSKVRTHQIEYLSFADWSDTARAERTVLKLTDGYFCAPQVFWFRPQKRWYLVYQVSDPARKPALQPAYSTTATLADAASWSRPVLLFDKQPENVSRWIDFWIIGDDKRMHLFFTSLDGKMWRADTPLADFPRGWSRPEVVLQADIFEASHTYRVQGREKYLTVVEAQAGGRRYYKAYLADRLDGTWQPLAATLEKSFASPKNVRPEKEAWTDSYSHGELLRAGHDERLEIAPERLQFLFQGVSDEARKGKPYGEIPWRLGLLRAAGPPRADGSCT